MIADTPAMNGRSTKVTPDDKPGRDAAGQAEFGGTVRFRPAAPADCREIAALFLVSSDGLAAYIWSLMDMPGMDLIEIGAQRYAREGVAFSYQNCLMAEQGGRVVGMLHSFPIEAPAPGETPAVESDPVLRPYAELEDPGSLYISGVAVKEAWRGQGVGTRLLAMAAERARSYGLPRLSLICFEANRGAMTLYRRLGFRETARRAIVPHPSLAYSEGDAVLMVRRLD